MFEASLSRCEQYFVGLMATHKNTMLHLVAARDLMIMFLSFNAFHIGLNIGGDLDNSASIDHCPYSKWYSSIFALFVLSAATTSVVANTLQWKNERIISITVDGIALPVGLFWLATTKPAGWYAAANVPGCDMFEVPWAYGLFLLGETLTFGTAVRGAVLAYSMEMPRLSMAIIVMGSFAISGLMWMVALIVREAYALN